MHDIDLMLQYQWQGKNKEAREISDKLENLGPNGVLNLSGKNNDDVWLRHKYNRGWFLIQEGKYLEGCQSLDAGRFLSVYGSPPLMSKKPIFNPNEHDLTDKIIILHLEGGFGDEMIHVRFAKSYKKMGVKKVIVSCSPDLKSLFSRVEGVDEVVSRAEAHLVEHDYWIPGFSSGWVAGHNFDNFPNDVYFSSTEEHLEKWKSKINTKDKIKVGIRWAGNPKFEHQQFRKFPIDFITNLKHYKEIQLFSFQKEHDTIDVPNEIVDLDSQLESWDDTVAALLNLDLLITSCTSLAHLAGGLGVKTWVVVPILPYHTWTWKCPESTTTPYYQNTTIFRQKEYRKWNETWQNLYKELENEYSLNHVELPNCDKEFKAINLGCGLDRMKDYINVDIEPLFEPDEIFDLNEKKWKWKDNEFSRITIKNVLQYVDNLENTIKEMYRISENNALWEIKIPSVTHDLSDAEINSKRKISFMYFMNLNQKRLMDDYIAKGIINNLFAYKEKIDTEIVDVSVDFNPSVENDIKNEIVNRYDAIEMSNRFNNMVSYVNVLVQVNKPPRYKDSEFEFAIKKVVEKKGLIENNKVGINKFLD